MELSLLPLTCSMVELGDVHTNDLRSVKSFLRRIEYNLKGFEEDEYDDYYANVIGIIQPVKTIIYNTTLNKKYYLKLKEAGFKKIASYKGHDGVITTFMKDLSKR